MKEEIENGGSNELSAVIGALLDSLEDRSPAANSAVLSALRSIAHHSPSTLIHAAVYFLELHRKLPPAHTSSVLRTMSETLRDSTEPLTEDLATSVAELSVSHLSLQDTEQDSSELLVSLSRLHCTQSMDGLLIKFQQGLIPSPPVIRAMGLITSCNPFGMVPFIRLTLSIVLPLLPQVHDETQKLAFCFLLGKFAEAINDYIMNLDEAPDPAISKDIFTEEMSKSFDILTNNWMKTSRSIKLLEATVSALSPILTLLPEEDGGQRAAKLTHTLLQLCKYPNCRLASTRALAILLNNTVEENREIVRPYLEQLQTTLFDLVNVTPFEAFRDALLTHYEVLQCFRSLVILYPEEGLDKILQHLKNPSGNYRARSLVILRHLINTLPSDDDASLQRIALSLQNSLSEGNARQMVGAIVALAAHPTLPLLPSQRAAFIKYIILKCGIPNEETQAYEEALFLLATTVDGAETWLWPALIKALLDPTFTASAIPILRSLSTLTVKIIRAESGNPFKEFSGTKILAKCLVLGGDENNRLAVVIFLTSAAPLLGHQLKPEWDGRLMDISMLLANEELQNYRTKLTIWEEHMVEFLEKSVELEGADWASKLSKELSLEGSPSIFPYLAAVTEDPEHLTMLIHSAKTHPFVNEYSRAVGIASKRHLSVILSLMEAACEVEDSKRYPTRLLGLVRDSKAAASAEASKAALLKCYAEICKRSDSLILAPHIERHIVPWILKQLNDSRETTTKEAGLIALEQIGGAVHPNRLANSLRLKARASCLASLLNLLQSHSGYRPLQLYPTLLNAMISLLRVPPALDPEERSVLLGTVLDKVIGASSEVDLILQMEGMQRVVDSLGIICGEVIGDSADALAELVDVLIPWMQSKSAIERRTTLLVLRFSLRSYHDSLKYTYPGGKLEPGRLLGRILSWSADAEKVLRPIVVDCVALALGINARHRSTLPDNNLTQDLGNSKKILLSDDANTFYEGVKTLATAACERISSGEVPNLAEGLIEGLLFRGESVAAGVSLIQLFKIRGADIPRSDLYLVDNIITQMRQMENSSCRQTSAEAIKVLTIHHPEEVFEHLLHQPLPLDRGTEECWRKLGAEKFGLITLDFLLNRLENNQLLVDSTGTKEVRHSVTAATASFPSLAAIVALRHLLQCPNTEDLIEKRLAEILGVLMRYLAGWLHVDAPVSVVSTKFGFVPNRDACKLDPHREVYSVLTNVLTVVNIHVASSLLNEVSTASESQAEENLVSMVRSVIRCLDNRNDVLVNVAQTLGKMVTSQIPAQRAVATAFYAEMIGRVKCGDVWLDAIINTLHQAKADSSGLVRKLATIGLGRIAYLEPRQMDEYFDNCTGALLDGLEEPSSGEGAPDVVLESLRGLSILLSLKTERPVSPRVVLALKPFVEKENWEMRLAAISALGALSRGWIKSVKSPDDDVSDHLLGCLPCLTIKIEDNNSLVAKAAKETLFEAAHLLQNEGLTQVLRGHLTPGGQINVEGFLKDLVGYLVKELPQRAEELRNAVVRGYSRSEVSSTRATAVLILGLFGKPRAEDVQRMLQLLRDKEGEVRARAAEALALGFTS